jgi:hypothetical protein
MNATEQQSVNSPLQLMPMAKVFTVWHLADENSRTVNPSPPESHAESHTVRINHASQMVKDTGGYFHGGLND